MRSCDAGRWKLSSVMQSQAESQKRDGTPSWSERRVAAFDWRGVDVNNDAIIVQSGVRREGSEWKNEDKRGQK